jgi:hypothetical protein
MNIWKFKAIMAVQIQGNMWVVIEATIYFACIYGPSIYIME